MLAGVPLRNAILQGSNQRTKFWIKYLSNGVQPKESVQPITDEEIQEIKSLLLSLDPNLFLSEKPKGQMSADMWEKYMIGNASLPTKP